MRAPVPILFALTACLDGIEPTPQFHVAGSWNHWSYFPDVNGTACYVVGTLALDSTLPDNTLTGTFDGWRGCGAQLTRGAQWTALTLPLAGEIDADSITLSVNPDLTLRGAWSASSMNGTAVLNGGAGNWNAVSCALSTCSSSLLLQPLP